MSQNQGNPGRNGNFLFINTDASTISGRSQRHEINSFVQINRDRAGKQMPLRIKFKDAKRILARAEKTYGVGKWRHSESPPPSKSCSADPALVVQASLAQTSITFENHNQSTSFPAQKLTLPHKGNSDPFSALAIEITPLINEVLAFHRNFIIPASFPFEKKYSKKPSEAMSRTWDDSVLALRDETLAHPFLAASAGSMAHMTFSAQLEVRAMSFKIRGYNILRQRIAKGLLDNYRMLGVILIMFWAELASRGTEAIVHLRTLSRLVHEHQQPEEISPWFRERLMQADVQYSKLFLTRPHFEVSRWSPESFHSGWREDVRFSTDFNRELSDACLDTSLSNKTLRDIFLDIRELLEIEHQIAAGDSEPESSLFRWLEVRKTGCESRLISHHRDMLDFTEAELSYNLAQAYACLAAMVWIDRAFPYHNQLPRHLANASRLCKAIGDCDRDPSQCKLYPKLRLWALYIGASFEQAVARGKDATETGAVQQQWYSVNLGKQVAEMELQSWKDVQDILKKFLYSDRIQLHGSEWCWKTLP